MSRPAANWERLRDQLWVRSGGHCEISGVPLDEATFDAHHRRPKGMGGTSRPDTDTLFNLLALDPRVHNMAGPDARSVHGDPLWAMERGYLLHQNAIPELAPWLRRGIEWVFSLDAAPWTRLDVEFAVSEDGELILLPRPPFGA